MTLIPAGRLASQAPLGAGTGDLMKIVGLVLVRWSGGGVWATAAVMGFVTVAGGAVATVGFRSDVGAAASYHDLAAVVLRWHDRLTLWSVVAWVAVAAELLLLTAWSLVRSHRRSIPRPPAVIAVLLVTVWVIHVGLTWRSHRKHSRLAGGVCGWVA